jgi:hypothetical protein
MLAGLAVVLHVLTVFALVAGITGRGRCTQQALKSTDLGEMRTLLKMSSVFERTMVRGMTGAVLLTGLLAAWARGWPILGFLQGGGVNFVLAALVIYLTIIPVIVLIFLPRGRVFERAMTEAVAENRITPALTAALRDPWVAAGRVYEMMMVAVLAYLMIVKPF